MALEKFGFTRDGGVWDGFADGLEQKYIQNVDLGEIYILEGPKKSKNNYTNPKTGKLLYSGYSPRILSTSQKTSL